MSISNEVAIRLIEDCKFARSRLGAILACNPAIDALVAEDVFGGRFDELLQSDIRSLTEAINSGEQELRSNTSSRQ